MRLEFYLKAKIEGGNEICKGFCLLSEPNHVQEDFGSQSCSSLSPIWLLQMRDTASAFQRERFHIQKELFLVLCFFSEISHCQVPFDSVHCPLSPSPCALAQSLLEALTSVLASEDYIHLLLCLEIVYRVFLQSPCCLCIIYRGIIGSLLIYAAM